MEKLDKKEITRLLDLYFEGESTLVDEQKLRDYFSSAHVEEEFMQVAPLFGYFAGEIEKMDKGDSQSENVVKMDRKRVFNFKFASVAVAASIAIIALTVMPFTKQSSVKLVIDGIAVENRELAMSKADDQLTKLNSLMAKVEQNVGNLEKINRIGDAVSSLGKIGRAATPQNEK